MRLSGSISLFTLLLLLNSCYHFNKSWDAIYKDHELLFRQNQATFNNAVAILDTVQITDTKFSVRDKTLRLPDSIIIKLESIGITGITVYQTKGCSSRDIRFEPSLNWDRERFIVLEITHNECDPRNKEGYHWQMDGSEHKHSFGQGGGWYIYSDSDLQ